MSTKSSAAFDFWNTSNDDYSTSFKTDNKKANGSGFSDFVNGYIQDVEILKKTKGMTHQAQGEILPSEATGALTQQGNLALQLVKESIQSLARQNIEALLDANNKANNPKRENSCNNNLLFLKYS